MSRAIDLSRLPPPDVVEPVDYETILAAMKADLAARWPDFQDGPHMAGDPLVKLLEVAAYWVTLVHQRVNDASRATMLATATGADLDNLAALLGVERLTVVPGNDDADPVMEPDADLRRRAALALEGYPTAGSVGAYRFHALSADGRVADVGVASPAPGEVVVTVLVRDGDGTPDAELLARVTERLTADRVRPLTDLVTVRAAQVTPVAIRARLLVEPGPAVETVRSAADSAVRAYLAERHRLGAVLALSGLAAALHQPGVRRVLLDAPTADTDPGADGVAHATDIEITAEVVS
ncbi:hypothetical protein CCR85_01305 [Rhodothalassium salexigens]|nr:hypothetical protein [Rhodothalassium salexigens]MBK5920743.1 hypothetical protein [Rhodothalassium salexigens]